MATIEVTRLARDELRELIETRQLPADTRERVSTRCSRWKSFRALASSYLARLARLPGADRSVGLADRRVYVHRG